MSLKKRSRKQEIPWSKELSSKLVLSVEPEQQLWNSFHRQYKNFKESRLIWNSVAEKIGRSVVDCINKWASLRSNFKTRRLGKLKSGHCDLPLDKMPEPFCHMGFLIEAFDKTPMLQVIAANHQPSSSREKIESSTNDEMTHTSSTHDTPNRRHHRYSRTSPQSLSISSQKDGKQRAAYVWIKKEDDEWDKTALLLAEHMRNTVKEFPTLADDFRTRLLQFTLDVQKKRSEMRTQNSINFAYIDMDDS